MKKKKYLCSNYKWPLGIFILADPNFLVSASWGRLTHFLREITFCLWYNKFRTEYVGQRSQTVRAFPGVYQDQIQSHHLRSTFLFIQLRKELIRVVEEDGVSIYRASRMLGIKNCTAKVILRQYRRKGHIFKRRSETRRKKKVQKEAPSSPPRQPQSEPEVKQ